MSYFRTLFWISLGWLVFQPSVLLASDNSLQTSSKPPVFQSEPQNLLLFDLASGQVLYQKGHHALPFDQARDLTALFDLVVSKRGNENLSLHDLDWQQERTAILKSLILSHDHNSGIDYIRDRVKHQEPWRHLWIHHLNDLGLEGLTLDQKNRLTLNPMATIPLLQKIFDPEFGIMTMINRLSTADKKQDHLITSRSQGMKLTHLFDESPQPDLPGLTLLIADKNGWQLGMVMTSQEAVTKRHDDARRLLSWVYDRFQLQQIDCTEQTWPLPVVGGEETEIPVGCEKGSLFVTMKGEENLQSRIQANLPLIAPVKQGDIVAHLSLYSGDNASPVSLPLIAQKTIAKDHLAGQIVALVHYRIVTPLLDFYSNSLTRLGFTSVAPGTL